MAISTLVQNYLNKMNKAAFLAKLGDLFTATNAEVKAETLTDRAVMVSNLRQGAAAVTVGKLEAMFVQHYQIAPANAGAATIKSAVTLTTAVQTVTAVTQPDVPRLLVLVANATVTTKVTINGTDINNAVLSEEVTMNSATPVPTVNAFKTITSIVLPIRTTAGDTIAIGTLNTFGMPHVIPYAGCLLAKLFSGSTDSGSLTVDAVLAKNLFAINGTPDGTKKLDFYYLV
jgi:hypothetical protein